jgi:hypothetical protein
MTADVTQNHFFAVMKAKRRPPLLSFPQVLRFVHPARFESGISGNPVFAHFWIPD